MSKQLNPMALFRLTVIGPLVSRDRLAKGELKSLIRMIAKQTYQIPNKKQNQISAKTIERWYYAWRAFGIDGLAPKKRGDHGKTHLSSIVIERLLALKKERRSRSINTLIEILEREGLVAKRELSRSGVHRLLVKHQLSKRVVSDGNEIERRSFEATHAGDIWYGDVMHGPRISTEHGQRKVYLVTLMDDASRLLCHSSFYFTESAVSIEHALKESVLKRGLPKKLVVDNGPAYRSSTLQAICARLSIRLVYCRPYEPEGKGKLERMHRVLREQFLSEIDLISLQSIDDLNARLWVWIEQLYHRRIHSSLENKMTPLARWQSDLVHVRQLGALANQLDSYFHHHCKRKVRKDGTVSLDGQRYEVPYELAGQTIVLVFDPHTNEMKWVESEAGERLGAVHALDKQANAQRRRQRPEPSKYDASPTKFVDII